MNRVCIVYNFYPDNINDHKYYIKMCNLSSDILFEMIIKNKIIEITEEADILVVDVQQKDKKFKIIMVRYLLYGTYKTKLKNHIRNEKMKEIFKDEY